MKKGNQQLLQKREEDVGDDDREESGFQELSERHRSESFSQKWASKQPKKKHSLHNSIEMEIQDASDARNQKKSFTLKIGKIKLPELPQANDILPKSAQQKEEPNYVIGNSYINVINLDGNHPEEERLWTKKSESSNKLDQQQRGTRDNSDYNFKIQASKSNAVSPQPNQQQPYLMGSQLRELNTLLKDYDVIYQKYPQHMYSSFNIVQCDLKKIQEIIALKKNSMDQELQVKPENKKDDHSFSTENKTVSYFQNESSALDCLQQDKQQQDLAIQFTKSCQYEGRKSRKHADSLQIDVRDKKLSIDDAVSALLDRKSNKSKENSIQQGNASSGGVLGSVSQQTNEIESINKNFNISLDLTKSKVQQNNSALSKQQQSRPNLSFESKFECGNLSYAFMKSKRQYLLLLQNDINTKGYTQWFYFRVSNQKLKGQVTFSILNYHKSYSLFSQGMKVLVYSKKKREKQNLGWHRSCQNITYYKNEYKRQSSSSSIASYYTLEFTYDFTDEGDEVYFAYNYPYTYTDLQNYLESIEKDNFKRQFVNRKVLCRTLAENRVDLLTITDGSSNYHINKQTIVVSARVHPGETVSSFMIKGLIDFLLEDTPDSSYLRNNFIFKIIPMLNPDGVIHGNYRCSLAGKDLNRQWKKPSKAIYAEIHFLKKLILSTKRLVLFCDLHGHSIKKNIFVYGCHDYSQPSACRELPYIISKIYQPFSFKDCNFKIQMEKQGTARVALWKTLRIPNIFTLESSFCGPSYDDIHFRLQDLQNVGKVLCQAFMIYFEPSQVKQGNISSRRNSKGQEIVQQDQDADLKSKQSSQYKEDFVLQQKQQLSSINNLMNLLNINKQDIQSELQSNQDLIKMGMKDSDGSDSCPSEDEIENVLKNPVIADDNKLDISKSPSPKKSLKKLPMKKGSEIAKTNLINCQPFQRPVAFNSSTSNAGERELIKPLANIKRLEMPCKSRLVLNDDLPQQSVNLNSLSPRNNITTKLKQKANHKNLSNKRDLTIPNSVLTHNNSINSNLINNGQDKSPLRRNLEPIEIQSDETVNLKSTLIFKRNPLYDYYESIQPKIKIKATDLGNLKRNLENEINNIVNNKRSLTPTKMVPNRLDQLLNYNMNSYNMSSSSNNNNIVNNIRNLSSNQSYTNNNRHFANEQKVNYFPSIKKPQIPKEPSPIPPRFNNQNFQSYLNNSSSNNSHSNYHQRNYSQQLRLDEETIYFPQNMQNLTPVNPHNKSLENSTIIQAQQYNSKSPQRLRKKYSFYQQNQLLQQNANINYLNTEPSEIITINTQNPHQQRLETEAYIIEEINIKHKKLLGRNNPNRSSSMKKKISLGGDQSINNTETLSYQPTSIRSKRPLNKLSIIQAVQPNLSNQNQNKIRLNEDFQEYIKFGGQSPFR